MMKNDPNEISNIKSLKTQPLILVVHHNLKEIHITRILFNYYLCDQCYDLLFLF